MLGRVLPVMLGLVLVSCASLYSGRDLPEVRPEELRPLPASVAFRFSSMTIHSRGPTSIRRVNSAESVAYIRSLNVFSQVFDVKLPFTYIELEKGASPDEFLKDVDAENSAEYLVDVKFVVPFLPHGGGLGMWGGAISVATLGIVPAWWHFDVKYEVTLYRNGIRLSKSSFEEDHHEFQSTLFHLVPSSENVKSGRLSKVGKNALRTVVKEVIRLIRETPAQGSQGVEI